MAFVLDASVTVSWYFSDEADRVARTTLERLATDEAAVPGVWWFEVRNALLLNERRGRIDPSQTAEILAHLANLPIRSDTEPRSEAVLNLARTHRLTVYDAAYLELARWRGLALATLDKALAAAAQAAHVPLLVEA